MFMYVNADTGICVGICLWMVPMKIILTGAIDNSDVGVVRSILNKSTTLQHYCLP